MTSPWYSSSLTTIVLLGSMAATRSDMEFSARAFDKGPYLRIRLVAKNGQASDAIAARPVVEVAKAGGTDLESYDAGFSSMETEVRRPDGRIITWIDLETPSQKLATLELLAGRLEVLAGGQDRELRVRGFRNKRSRKISSAALQKAGIELSASVKTEAVLRIAVKNGTGRVTGLRMEGTQVDYHATTDPERPHLVAHHQKGKLPKGAVVVVEVKGASGKAHTFRLEKLEATAKPRPIEVADLEGTGVELMVSRAECHLLRVKATSPEHELLDVQLASADQELAWDSVMSIRTPTVLELERTYAEIPKDAELVLHLRQGAEWVGVPFSLSNLPVK